MILSAVSIAGATLALLPEVPVWALALLWCVGGFGRGLVFVSLEVLLLNLCSPHEAGANSAALQVGDALGIVVLLSTSGTAFAALADMTTTTAGGHSPHPTAFSAVLLPAAALSLAGAMLAARLQPPRTRHAMPDAVRPVMFSAALQEGR